MDYSMEYDEHMILSLLLFIMTKINLLLIFNKKL